VSGAARPRAVNTVGAEVRLAYLEAKIAGFLETVPDAMILSDQQGRIVLVNSNTERMFGYSRDELLGKEIEILIPDWVRSLHRRNRIAYYADPGIRPMGVGAELYAWGKDGVEFPVDITLSQVHIKRNTFVWSAIRNIRGRQHSIAQTREAIKNKLIALKGLLSVCAWCKKIHDEGGSWEHLDKYIQTHSRIQFTHGICPNCLRQLDPKKH
jgi:PAS domain S-box-containing protein